MDKSLGDIVANIERHGLTDDTIVLFMSDNGGLSAGGRGGKAHTHNKPLSSGKGSAHEGGVRVPMIACWPGVSKPASICSAPVIIEDFFPSLLELAGVKGYEQIGGVLDGVSFAPLLREPDAAPTARAFFWHYPNCWGPKGPGIGASSAVRQGDWKLIYYHDPERAARYELFDLAVDLGEQKNLFADRPEKARELADVLRRFLVETKAQMPIVKKTGKAVALPKV